MCEWTFSIQFSVWKEENKYNWNEFCMEYFVSLLNNVLEFCGTNGWSRHWIIFSLFRESVYCGLVLVVWTEDWLQRRRGSSIESAANACMFMLRLEGGLSHLWKVNWLLLAFALKTVAWQSLITRRVMNLTTGKVFVLIWLPQHDILREIFVCVCVYVCVVVLLYTFLWFSGDSYSPKQRAKIMTSQAASVSLNIFFFLRK